MGIVKTGDAFKSLTFDGEDSRDYGIYITGSAVYNAPERDVEMIEIPGRNGAFALDNGRFQNIEVTYPAGIFADNETDFAEGISDFRNFLCSRKGYVRLTDEYNLDEYRLAVYKSGLEVSPAQLKAGEFDITFECKPQRYLLSGENEITVESGDVINNPTLFASSPFMEAHGLGDINLVDGTITITDELLGNVELYSQGSGISLINTRHFTLENVSALNDGDTITWNSLTVNPKFNFKSTAGTITVANTTNCTATPVSTPQTTTPFNVVMKNITFNKGTDGTFTASFTILGGGTAIATETITINYDAADDDITMERSPSIIDHDKVQGLVKGFQDMTWTAIVGNSTVSLLPDTIYIDLDIGEAYYISEGSPIQLNNNVVLPATLPTLQPGENEITYDNTITSLKVIPRWWKV